MNIHALPRSDADSEPAILVDGDDAIAIQDMLLEASTMADIAAFMVCEAFDDCPAHKKMNAIGKAIYEVPQFRVDHIVFAVSETFRRLKAIENAFSEKILSKT